MTRRQRKRRDERWARAAGVPVRVARLARSADVERRQWDVRAQRRAFFLEMVDAVLAAPAVRAMLDQSERR